MLREIDSPMPMPVVLVVKNGSNTRSICAGGMPAPLSAMLNEGAMLSDQDFPVLLNYLARNFRQ